MLDTANCIGNGRTEGLFHHCNRMCSCDGYTQFRVTQATLVPLDQF